MRRGAARPGVFGPYVPERSLDDARRLSEVAYCPRCKERGVTSTLAFDTDGLGRCIEACDRCGHAQPAAPSETTSPKARWGA